MGYFPVETKSANFRIILEKHDVLPFENDIKGEWDGIFLECIFNPDQIKARIRSEVIKRVCGEILVEDLWPVLPQVVEGRASVWFGDVLDNPRFDPKIIKNIPLTRVYLAVFYMRRKET